MKMPLANAFNMDKPKLLLTVKGCRDTLTSTKKWKLLSHFSMRTIPWISLYFTTYILILMHQQQTVSENIVGKGEIACNEYQSDNCISICPYF